MIEGLEHLEKDGWELVRIGPVKYGEWRLMDTGKVMQWTTALPSIGWAVVLRKIEKPKQYRQFANAAEFAPHRDRWWKKTTGEPGTYPPCYYNDSYYGGLHFARCFVDRTFDDGTPFGVEVQS